MTRKSILLISTLFISATISFILSLPNSTPSNSLPKISIKQASNTNELEPIFSDESTAKHLLPKVNESNHKEFYRNL